MAEQTKTPNDLIYSLRKRAEIRRTALAAAEAALDDAHLSRIAAEEERELLRHNNLQNCLQIANLQEELLRAKAEAKKFEDLFKYWKAAATQLEP